MLNAIRGKDMKKRIRILFVLTSEKPVASVEEFEGTWTGDYGSEGKLEMTIRARSESYATAKLALYTPGSGWHTIYGDALAMPQNRIVVLADDGHDTGLMVFALEDTERLIITDILQNGEHIERDDLRGVLEKQ